MPYTGMPYFFETGPTFEVLEDFANSSTNRLVDALIRLKAGDAPALTVQIEAEITRNVPVGNLQGEVRLTTKNGERLVGQPARRQALTAPERTVSRSSGNA